MIESIEFHNFKVLREATLRLGRFNLLVGPNGGDLLADTRRRRPKPPRIP